MAAFLFDNIIQNRYYIRLDSGIAETETDYALALDAARLQTGSQTAVLYAFQPESSEVKAIAARFGIAARLREVGVTLSHATSQWIESLAGPAQGKPAAEANFERFPEVLQFQLKRLMVIPLCTEHDLLGLLTLGRPDSTGFDSAAIQVALRAGRLLVAVLERDSLQQKLAEHKLVERAQEILQQRRRLSEEQAYLLLRNDSRRRRVPMVKLAREIIDVSVQASTAGHWQPA